MADEYTDTYREKCFQTWYSAGRPAKVSKILAIIPADDAGRKPNRNMISHWLNEGWLFRADELDAKAIQLADDHLILEKVKMLKDQANRGEKLQEMGMEHLKVKGFDSASAAVGAVIRGAELERTSRGIGELILKMAKMSDSDLKDAIMERLQILSDESVVDASVKEETHEEANETTD